MRTLLGMVLVCCAVAFVFFRPNGDEHGLLGPGSKMKREGSVAPDQQVVLLSNEEPIRVSGTSKTSDFAGEDFSKAETTSTTESSDRPDGPMIRGRVVHANGSHLLSPTQVYASFELDGEGGGTRPIVARHISTDSGGQFAIGCPQSANSSTVVEFSFSASDGNSETKYQCRIGDLKEAPWGWLVGDLYLGNPRSIHVLIQDAAGDAIAGAIAFTVPHQTLQSEKSDELGRCLIEGAQRQLHLPTDDNYTYPS